MLLDKTTKYMLLEKTTERKKLTKDEELEIGTKVQAWLNAENDPNIDAQTRSKLKKDYDEAYTVLFQSNIPLVINRANKACGRFPSSNDINDLIQEGALGLMTAIHKYDPQRGNRFSTVAHLWIVQRINRADNTTGRMVRLPENRISDYMKIQKLTRELENDDLDPADIEQEIIDRLGLTPSEIHSIRNGAGHVTSLDIKVGSDDGAQRTLIDFVDESETTESTEESALRFEASEKLDLLLNTLSDVELAVLRAHCKLEDPKTNTILKPHHVREQFGISSKVYKNICETVLESLRYHAQDMGLSESDFIKE